MKSRFAISLALNVVLLGLVAWLWTQRSQRAEVPVASHQGNDKALSSNAVRGAQRRLTPAATKGEAPEQFDWRAVESENYKQYIANLRSIGCPEETIRDIIIADVNKLFDSRRKDLFPATNRFEYWKGGNFLAALLDESKMQKEQALNAEKRALLKELLGVDVPDTGDIISGTKTFDAMLDFLPAEKRTQIMELEQKFAARMAKSMKDIQRGDLEAFKRLQAEKDEEMLKLLSPDEKFEYDLRMSQSAMMMRMQMGDFETSEQEFRDLFKLRKQFDDEFGAFGIPPSKPEERERRTTAQKQLDADTRRVLGEDRFLEYKYSDDFARSSFSKIADEFQIPKQKAYKVYDIRDVAQAEAAQVRGNKALTAEERQFKLDQIRATTEQELGNLIGQPARDKYVEQGSWIKNLNSTRSGGSSN